MIKKILIDVGFQFLWLMMGVFIAVALWASTEPRNPKKLNKQKGVQK